ncbi:hypothetical protein HI914_00103 [Erysiphe necator]|nr:hypothetical protein HI914_00103 [Erysiphe necator]
MNNDHVRAQIKRTESEKADNVEQSMDLGILTVKTVELGRLMAGIPVRCQAIIEWYYAPISQSQLSDY